MVLAFGVSARRYVGLAILLFFAVPFGASLAGCKHATAVDYCNAGDSGPTTGQVSQIILSQNLATTGESLNYGQIGQGLSASAQDCKGNAVSISHIVYASTSSFGSGPAGTVFADINPSTGSVCGGLWNRNSGGGIADYTTCTPPTNPSGYLAYVTATAEGTVSNAIAVYVHPTVTGVVLGPATPNCATSNDPGTDCFPVDTSGTQVVAPVYTGNTCLSQNQQGQLVARVYANGNNLPANNITGKVGHISYATQGASNVVTIDANGVATANLPGSAIITTTIANSSSGSSAGYFATCPPKSIVLAIPGQAGATSVNVTLNTPQPLTATVLDTNNNPITGLNLEYNSTTPQTIPGSNNITAVYPGTAVITAVCQPGTCNPAPFSQIGLYGNGKPITSNGITVNAAGTSGTVIYMASTQSQYVLPRDFTTTNSTQSFIKLQYPPNSMVLSQDGSQLYLGSPQGLMTIATASNAATAPNQSFPGLVLAVSPDGGTVVVTDPIRQTISLLSSGGAGLKTAYNGIGTHAVFSPDSQLLYVTTQTGTGPNPAAGPLLIYSTFTDWQVVTPAPSELYTDATVTVPSIGAYFAGQASTDGRSYCSTSSVGSSGNPPSVTNAFAPLADTSEPYATDRLAATTDGAHILGATATGPAFVDIGTNLAAPVNATQPNGPQVCTTATAGVTFSSTLNSRQALTGIAPVATGTTTQSTVGTAITGVIPSANSALAFVTYNGTSGKLPVYVPSTKTLSYLTLGNGATTASAPVSGVFSTDNLTFYTGTSGDDQVHIFSITGTTATESSVITPNLPDANGNPVQVNLLAQRPKKLTN